MNIRLIGIFLAAITMSVSAGYNVTNDLYDGEYEFGASSSGGIPIGFVFMAAIAYWLLLSRFEKEVSVFESDGGVDLWALAARFGFWAFVWFIALTPPLALLKWAGVSPVNSITELAIASLGCSLVWLWLRLPRRQCEKADANGSNYGSRSRPESEADEEVRDLKLCLASIRYDHSFFAQIYPENYNFSQLEAFAYSSDVPDVDRANFDYLLDFAKSNYSKVADQYRECSETAIVAMSICQMKEELELEIARLEKQILSLESIPAN